MGSRVTDKPQWRDQETAAAPASATAWSFSTLLPETPIAPIISLAAPQRYPAGKRYQPTVRVLDVAQRGCRAGGKLSDRPGIHIEEACRACLADSDIDGADPGTVHAQECLQIGAGVHDGNVHGEPKFAGLAERCLNGSLGLFEGDIGQGWNSFGHLLPSIGSNWSAGDAIRHKLDEALAVPATNAKSRPSKRAKARDNFCRFCQSG